MNNKKTFVLILQKITIVFAFISFAFVMAMHELTPVTPYIIAFDIIAIFIVVAELFIDNIIKEDKYYEYIYDIITLSILNILALIILFQYPTIYKALWNKIISVFI